MKPTPQSFEVTPPSTSRAVEISVVIPVYRAEACLPELQRRLDNVLQSACSTYEIVYVDDRSPDQSWRVLKNLKQNTPQIKLVRLSRNFGQHAAITAGLAHARGQIVIVMDCDLQDPPELISRFIEKIRQGNDVVLGKRISRNHSFWRVFSAKMYFLALGFLAGAPINGEYGSFSAIRRKVVDAYLRFSDRNRHYLMILMWLGFDRSEVEYEHSERHAGKSSYSLLGLIRHAIEGLMFQTTRALEAIIGMGFFISACGGMLAVYIVYGYLVHSSLPGWTSLAVLLLFMTGILLVSLGIVGMYIGQIFEQVKFRPLFIVAEESTVGEVELKQDIVVQQKQQDALSFVPAVVAVDVK